MTGALRIAINAQLRPGSGVGGLETVLRVLSSLSSLDDGDEEYVFVGPSDDYEWLRPHLGSRGTIVPVRLDLDIPVQRVAPPQSRMLEPIKRMLRPGRALLRRLVSPPQEEPLRQLPSSNGFFESLGCEVIHFPFQWYVQCELPAVYNPHDLQHLHYPEFFSDEVRQWRGWVYPAACRSAHTVVAASRFIEDDIARRLSIPREKLQTIWWAPLPLSAREVESEQASCASIRARLHLPDNPFMLYPAMTWAHKNHIRLIEAIALLRDRYALRVHLVCSGAQNEHFGAIERAIKSHRLNDQVHFVGMVSHTDLGALYRSASFVVVPTLFEAASAPVFEAWQRGKAVACAAVTSLPEQAGDAAFLFDPLVVEDIARVVRLLSTDSDLRAALEQRGVRRLQVFDPQRTARSYRAVYRRAAGRALSDEDRWLLMSGAEPPAAGEV